MAGLFFRVETGRFWCFRGKSSSFPGQPPLEKMLVNSSGAISPNLDIKYFCGQQNICGPSLSDVRSRLPLRSQAYCEKLTYWSQIASSPGEIQYPRDISGNHLFRHERGILRRPRCPGAGCVSITMAVIRSFGSRSSSVFFRFSQG